MFYLPVNRIIQTVALVDKFEMNKDFVHMIVAHHYNTFCLQQNFNVKYFF